MFKKTDKLIRLNLKLQVGLDLHNYSFETSSKNHQDRIIPITDNITKSLLKLTGSRRTGFIFRGRQDQAMSRLSAYLALKRRVKASGINKNVRPHTFRHHWITIKLDRGVPLPQVQKFVGHTSLSSTSLYYHFTQADLRKVLEM